MYPRPRRFTLFGEASVGLDAPCWATGRTSAYLAA
ncbi:MAG: hypothetical protein JWQ77_618 [Jatrophihabitans sp.]|nr:hypothetical protein [Jatrophihabitans sp.]